MYQDRARVMLELGKFKTERKVLNKDRLTHFRHFEILKKSEMFEIFQGAAWNIHDVSELFMTWAATSLPMQLIFKGMLAERSVGGRERERTAGRQTVEDTIIT